MGRAQAKALGCPDLPIAVVPHPFGIRSRDEIRQLAERCVDDVARLSCESVRQDSSVVQGASSSAVRAALIEAPEELDEFNRFSYERRWGDGLMVTPPTPDRVTRMLRHTRRAPDEVVATIAPGFGAATVERIAINAVLAGCYPEYLPILIAATEAVAEPKFHLQGIQTSTSPAAVWLIINGPIVQRLEVNSGGNCLGPGTWANATLGRAMQMILRNIGGALPGEMDRATHGQPGKYTFCCAENEEASPWEPLHVERGFAPDCSTVTVVGASGMSNLLTHAKDAGDLVRVIAGTMTVPASHVYSGEPWLILSPEHAHILKRDGLNKAEVKRRLWEHSKMLGSRQIAKDLARTREARRAELGEIGADTLIPISVRPEDISIVVAGGAGIQSIYVSIPAHMRSVTREVTVSR